MQGIVLAGGNVTEKELAHCEKDAWVVCADSGLDRAVRLHLSPDLVVGDMDSVQADYTQFAHEVFPKSKDQTDTELAVLAALKHGCDRLLILGATGGRLDHTLANLSLLLLPAKKGVPAWIVDDRQRITLTCKGIRLTEPVGSLLSLLPVGVCCGVTTTGLLYPLKGETLSFGEGRGVSNVFAEPTAEVFLTSGHLFVVLPESEPSGGNGLCFSQPHVSTV